MKQILNKNLIAIAIVIAGIIIGGAYFFTNQETIQGLSAQEAADKAINFINQSIEENVTASLLDVTDEGVVYRIHLKIAETEYNSYITKDGTLLFPNAFNLEEQAEESSQSASQDIATTDRPDVKLFVMSYCPYGLQAQKMFLPVYNLLKNRAEMEIYFVDFIMHGKKEIDENLRQYCIQEEQQDKYYDYLSCFVRKGDFNGCLLETGIDKEILEACVLEADDEYDITAQYNDKNTWLEGSYPMFDIHRDLNEKYGVRGSPAVVINDTVIVSNQTYCPQGEIKCSVIPDFTRSPEKFKELICQAFNSEISECSQALSEDAFSPGFGMELSPSSGGSCE